MAAVRVLNGVLREVWTEAVSVDGGTAPAIITAIPVPRTDDLSRCYARLHLNTVTGAPTIGQGPAGVTTAFSRVNGLLVITFMNTAAAGNSFTYTLEVGILHSINQNRDAAYGGFWEVIGPSTTGTVTPPSGTVRIYVDAQNGSDANDGTNWGVWPLGGDAVQTYGRANRLLQEMLDQNPTALNAEMHLRGRFPAGDLVSYSPVMGITRVHLVHDVDQWQTVSLTAADTITASAVDLHTTDGFWGFQTSGVTWTPTAAQEGMFVEISEAGAGVRRCVTQITRVNVNGVPRPVVYTNIDNADLPGWIGVNAVVRLIGPALPVPAVSSGLQIDGDISFRFDAASLGTSGSVVSPMSWLFGIRADNIYVSGGQIGLAGCVAVSAANALGNILLQGNGCEMRTGYRRTLSGGIPLHMLDSQATSWGIGLLAGSLFSGLTIGSHAASIVMTGCGFGMAMSFSSLIGHASTTVTVGLGMVTIEGTGTATVTMLPGGFATLNGVIVDNGILASTDQFIYVGGNKARGFTHLCSAAPGGPTIEAVDGGFIRVANGAVATALEVTPGSVYPNIAVSSDNATIQMDGVGYPDALIGAVNQIVTVNGGKVFIDGGITMTAARPGGGPDIDIGNGELRVTGGIVKTALNTVGSTLLVVGEGGFFWQDPNSVFTIPDPVTALAPAPGIWTDASTYGAGGAIIVDHSGRALLGVVSEPAAAAATLTGVNVRHGGKLLYGAGTGAGALGGAAVLQIGAMVAADTFPPVVSTTDISIGATSELCQCGTR